MDGKKKQHSCSWNKVSQVFYFSPIFFLFFTHFSGHGWHSITWPKSYLFLNDLNFLSLLLIPTPNHYLERAGSFLQKKKGGNEQDSMFYSPSKRPKAFSLQHTSTWNCVVNKFRVQIQRENKSNIIKRTLQKKFECYFSFLHCPLLTPTWPVWN